MSCRTVVSRPKHPPRPSFAIHAIWEPRPQGHTLWRKRFPAAYTQHFSSSSAIAAEKPLVLDKPDKFRPPSHPTRLNARRMPRYYPGPPIPEAEKQAQAKRKYPHTFPKQGTRMHWFLTNKYVHVWISLVRPLLPPQVYPLPTFLNPSLGGSPEILPPRGLTSFLGNPFHPGIRVPYPILSANLSLRAPHAFHLDPPHRSHLLLPRVVLRHSLAPGIQVAADGRVQEAGHRRRAEEETIPSGAWDGGP